MESLGIFSKLYRFFYQQLYVRFNSQIREPWLIRVDKIYHHPSTNELTIAFHIANKRVDREMPVAEFVKSDMIYLVEPRIVFDLGQQYGAHSEKLNILNKAKPSIKTRCTQGLKRVFIDG